jgi:hypothetical protein
VDSKADVSGIRELRATAVDADSDAYLDAIAPRAVTELTLNCHGRLEGCGRLREDREEFVGTCVDLAPARSLHGSTENGSDALQQGAVAIAQLTEQYGRSLDVGHQERDEPPGQPGRNLLPLRLQLTGDESDRYDSVLLRRVQQPPSCSFARGMVLEATWLNRASAFRTWALSWIGNRRRPAEST